MARQWLRKAILTLQGSAGLLINGDLNATHDLRIRFDVVKDHSSKANQARIEIWNLSPDHRGMLNKEYQRARLEAGYQGELGSKGNVALIFDGEIREIEHVVDGPDVISRLTFGDGDKVLRKGVISKSWRAGTTIIDLIHDIHLQMEDVDLGEIKGIDPSMVLTRPFTVSNNISREMDNLGRTYGFYWSILDNVFEAFTDNQVLGDTVVISAETGMIGTPALTDDGIKLTALLNPQIAPGRLIDVRSLSLNDGLWLGYRVKTVRHQGDNMDGDFASAVEAVLWQP